MRLSLAASAFALTGLWVMLAVGCGTSSSSHVSDAAASTGGGSSTGATGPVLGPIAGLAGGSGNAPGEKCAGNRLQAERIPLDIYVMLDLSGSMLQPTVADAKVSKWQAVSSALRDFVTDRESDGIGVGLQVFPIAQAKAPVSCTSDPACGAFGPCLNRNCWPLIAGRLRACLDDGDCQRGQACKVVGSCSNDDSYVCDFAASASCNGGLGECVVQPSVCLSATDCRSATYATAAAEIAALPGARAALLDVIDAALPDPRGLTPTGPALTGAIQRAKAWGAAHRERQVVVVLATDGLPTLKSQGQACAPVRASGDIDAVVNVAGGGRSTLPAISTFVIGVLAPEDINAGAPDILDAIASAGGSEQAFVVNTQGNVQQAFRAALDQIRQAGLSCDLLVPQAEAGRVVDYDQVNVTFTGDPTLASVGTAERCDPVRGGWYYDVNPALATPTRILTCPATCEAFKRAGMESVEIELGCKTRGQTVR